MYGINGKKDFDHWYIHLDMLGWVYMSDFKSYLNKRTDDTHCLKIDNIFDEFKSRINVFNEIYAKVYANMITSPNFIEMNEDEFDSELLKKSCNGLLKIYPDVFSEKLVKEIKNIHFEGHNYPFNKTKF